MQYVVLGAGQEGKVAIDDLVESDVEEIVIGDYEIEKADATAEKHKDSSTEIKTKKVDANEKSQLVNLMEGSDLVANTVGPFYEYGTKILKAAIEAGTDFIDICDDSQPTIEELNLNGEAKNAGITAIVGLGNNPGTGNLCAKYGANKLDKAEEIDIYWLHPASSEKMSGGKIHHALEIFSGQVPSYQNEELVEVSASSGKEEIEFPEPVGPVELYHSGHPEPITIPRYIEGVNTVLCKGGITPVWANRDLRKFIDYGLTSTEPIEVDDSSVVPREFTKAFLESFTSSLSKELGVKASRTVVEGRKNGTEVSYIYDRIGKIWTAGVPLSIGAQMIAEDDIDKEGAFPPEACVDPEKFLKELERREMEIRERIERGKISI